MSWYIPDAREAAQTFGISFYGLQIDFLDDVAERVERSRSDVIRHLIEIGIKYLESVEPHELTAEEVALRLAMIQLEEERGR